MTTPDLTAVPALSDDFDDYVIQTAPLRWIHANHDDVVSPNPVWIIPAEDENAEHDRLVAAMSDLDSDEEAAEFYRSIANHLKHPASGYGFPPGLSVGPHCGECAGDLDEATVLCPACDVRLIADSLDVTVGLYNEARAEIDRLRAQVAELAPWAAAGARIISDCDYSWEAPGFEDGDDYADSNERARTLLARIDAGEFEVAR